MTRVNRKLLVQTALDLVDEAGADALSMRAVAARVDRQVSSLYNHIASRGDLIEAMRARIVASIDTSAFATEPWDVAAAEWARSYLRAFAAHPNLIRLLATTPIRDASTFEMYDIVIGALMDGGWPIPQAVAVLRTLEAHVLGSALDIVAPGDMFDQASVPRRLRIVHAAFDPEYAEASSAESAFQLGLDALVVGLRAHLAEHVRTVP